nr:uncharacterized protein LOC128698334 isoform X2 [Cherax quadricarinatus]
MGLRDIKNSSEPCESSQPLRILVRHSVHGLSRFKNEKLLSKAYTIYPKLENQAYFGCEVNTLSEITQQWIQLLTRPNTTLLQGRCTCRNSICMQCTQQDLSTPRTTLCLPGWPSTPMSSHRSISSTARSRPPFPWITVSPHKRRKAENKGESKSEEKIRRP